MVIGFLNIKRCHSYLSVIRNLLQTNSLCDYILVYICWYIFGSVDGHHNGTERLFPDLDDLPLAFLLVMIHPGAIKNENCLYQVFLAISCHIFQLFIAKHFFLKWKHKWSIIMIVILIHKSYDEKESSISLRHLPSYYLVSNNKIWMFS